METENLPTAELPERTSKSGNPLGRLIVDITFGIIAPIICLIFDPAVFRGDVRSIPGPILPRWRVFAYAAIALGIIMLAVWLWRRFRIGAWSGFVAGVLFTGALCSFLLGLVLLPITLLGLLLIVGIFGFIPFLTAFVFFRNARQALNYANKHLNVTGIIGSFIVGMVVSVSIPALIHWGAYTYVSAGIHDLVEQVQQDNADVQPEVNHLQAAFWCSTECYDDLMTAHHLETDPVKQERLASAYQTLTGLDVNWLENQSD